MSAFVKGSNSSLYEHVTSYVLGLFTKLWYHKGIGVNKLLKNWVARVDHWSINAGLRQGLELFALRACDIICIGSFFTKLWYHKGIGVKELKSWVARDDHWSFTVGLRRGLELFAFTNVPLLMTSLAVEHHGLFWACRGQSACSGGYQFQPHFLLFLQQIFKFQPLDTWRNE